MHTFLPIRQPCIAASEAFFRRGCKEVTLCPSQNIFICELAPALHGWHQGAHVAPAVA